MEFYVNQLFDKMIHDIEIIFEKNEKIITSIELVIPLIQNTIKQLKNEFLSNDNEKAEDEIYFFKYVKPKFHSRLIYYIDLFQFEIQKPTGFIQEQIQYIRDKSQSIQKFQVENKEFLTYYKSNASYLDQIYFTRGNEDFRIKLNHLCFESDPRFSTSHDYLLARFISNELLMEYYEEQIALLSNTSPKSIKTNKPVLKWTSSKTNLIELVYALQEIGCFNNGDADIKVIASTFSTMFDIPLGDVYRTYLDLKSRNNPTKFLENLRDNLENRMLEDDL
jgi:hypothetical protein